MVLSVLISSLHISIYAAESEKFSVGAAKVDITPSAQDLPKPYGSVFQHIYARVIAVDNGKSRAILASVDVSTLSEDFPARFTQRIAREAGIAPEHVLLAQTHAHDSIMVGEAGPGMPMAHTPAFDAKVEAALAEGVQQAIKNLQPARIGFGRGRSYINTNRMQWDPEQMRYVVGADRSGLLPTDKTVNVVSFETTAGKPIALLANYSLMPIAHLRDGREGSNQRLGGDVPDATSLYLEKAMGNDAVAIMTMAGENQHPIYQIDKQAHDAVERSEELTLAYGVMLGEEILAVSRDIKTRMTEGPIYTASNSATCPGKTTTPKTAPGPCTDTANGTIPQCAYKEQDTPPVTFKMGLLMLGNIAIDGMWEIVDATIIQRIEAASPYANTFVISRFMGPAGYLVHDEGYETVTFDSINTHLKAGCGEQAAIKGFLDMLPATQ
jgi:hypothetical protein